MCNIDFTSSDRFFASVSLVLVYVCAVKKIFCLTLFYREEVIHPYWKMVEEEEDLVEILPVLQ